MATHKKRYTAQEWFDRAILFRNTGELHKAADACRCAIILNPLNPDYHIHLARSLRSLDKCEEAIWVLKRAIKLSPNEPTAIHLLNTLEKRKVGTAPIGYIESLFDHYAATFDHCMNGSSVIIKPGSLLEGVFPRCHHTSNDRFRPWSAS